MPPSDWECNECPSKVLREETVKCEECCGKIFCIKCSKIKRSEIKQINENINLKWFCNECSISNNNMKFLEIKQLVKKIDENKLKANDFKDIIEETCNKKFKKFKSDLLSDLLNNIQNTIEELLESKYEKMKKEFVKAVECEINKQSEAINNQSEIIKKLSENNNNNNDSSGNNSNSNANAKVSYAEAVRQKEKNKIILKPSTTNKKNKEDARPNGTRFKNSLECDIRKKSNSSPHKNLKLSSQQGILFYGLYMKSERKFKTFKRTAQGEEINMTQGRSYTLYLPLEDLSFFASSCYIMKYLTPDCFSFHTSNINENANITYMETVINFVRNVNYLFPLPSNAHLFH